MPCCERVHTNQRCYFNATNAWDEPACLVCTSSICGHYAQLTQVLGLPEAWHLPWDLSESFK